MRQQRAARRVVTLALVFAFGLCAGAAATLGYEVVKVRQVLVARIEGAPLEDARARSAEFLVRLVSSELSLDAAQRELLKRSIVAHEGEILAARAAMGDSVRRIAGLVYEDLQPTLDPAQRQRAEAILRRQH